MRMADVFYSLAVVNNVGKATFDLPALVAVFRRVHRSLGVFL